MRTWLQGMAFVVSITWLTSNLGISQETTGSADSSPNAATPQTTDEPTSEESTDENSPSESEAEESINEQQFLQDPFSYLQSDMQSGRRWDLKDGETRPPAEVTQPRILKHLSLLIEQLERQSQGAGQAGQRAIRPGRAIFPDARTGRDRTPCGPPGMTVAIGADLSPQERQKILQSKTDGFPAGYDAILADYFRRLARAEATSPPQNEPPADGGQILND